MNRTFIIEDYVPIPPSEKGKIFGQRSFDKYPFLKMKVGQSFSMPCKFVKGKMHNSDVYAYAKKCGVKVTIRPDGPKNIRVWLVDDTNKVNVGE